MEDGMLLGHSSSLNNSFLETFCYITPSNHLAMWLWRSFQSTLETPALVFQWVVGWYLLPVMERDRTQAQKSPWILHREGKHSLLIATEVCSPFLLSSSTSMNVSAFEPPHAQKEKNFPWASHRKWNAGNTISKYSLPLTVSPFYCSGCNHSSGERSFPHHSQQHGRQAALAGNAGRWFFPLPFRTLLTRTKGIKKEKGFFIYLFPLLVNESNFSLAISAVVNTFSHCILLGLFSGEGFDGRGLLFSTDWYLRQFPVFFSLICPICQF